MPTRPPKLRPPHQQSERDRKAAIDRRRAMSSDRGYGADWRTFRDAVVIERGCRCEAPGCGRPVVLRKAEAGRHAQVANVDHIVPIAVAPERRLDRSNVRVLCESCHSARTAAEQGFNQGKRARRRSACRRDGSPIGPDDYQEV